MARFPKSTLGGLARRLSFIIVALSLSGCGTSPIQSQRLDSASVIATGGDGANKGATGPFTTKGIPYYLPIGALTVSIESQKDEKGKHKALVISSATKFVADPSAGYLLHSPDAFYASKTHEVKLAEGMLTSVATEDNNQLGDIIADLLASTINIHLAGATGGVPESADAAYPDDAEIKDLLNGMPAGPQEFLFASNQTDSSALVPGPKDVLEVAVLFNDTFTGAAFSNAEKADPNAKKEDFSGIYARVLKPVSVTTTLRLRLKEFYDWRITGLKAKIESNEISITALEKAIRGNKDELEAKQKDQEALNGAVADLKNGRDRLEIAKEKEKPGTPERVTAETAFAQAVVQHRIANDNLAALSAEVDALTKPMKDKEKLAKENENLHFLVTKNEGWQKSNQGTYSIATRTAATMLPDTKLIVQVPVSKASLGISKNAVTLQSGVVVGYRTEKPSVGLASVRILKDTVSGIVAIPSQLIKLRIDYAKNGKELLEAQQALADLKAKIAKGVLPASDHAVEVQKLQAEKEVLALQKEIAELREAIAKLTPKS